MIVPFIKNCSGELERKIVLVVDASLQQQLQSWQRKPPVPSASFKAIGKQLAKLLEAIQVLNRDQIQQIKKQDLLISTF